MTQKIVTDNCKVPFLVFLLCFCLCLDGPPHLVLMPPFVCLFVCFF